ncbi:polyketide synthase Pks13 [Corynebacterium comes]|uniref:Phthiocerol/phenolphthiocerol synthesis polyketide synthase type I PpsA n=1 Tax=Corynebacterium comes TaxID=2675218 RepID=A0A6B8VNT2_9CORY|nr:polyketide synthase Pks13 [Corynebacterium comes]QGU05713.1 Phthiocerol/phenolphthiocerol synthesis polyketide synthase type I PpsA [Corynebacterium comes]
MSESRTPATMNVEQLRGWLRAWVVEVSGLSPEEVTDTKPMENFGLSSRDAVILSGELENLLGVQLDATIAYEYPTIQALAQRLVEGEPVSRERTRPRARHSGGAAQTPGTHDIAIIGMGGRFPGADTLEEYWSMLVEGRDGTGELPIGRWSEYSGEEVMSAKMAEQSLTGGYLTDLSSFDAEFFGLSPLEAANMDPQQRIMLEVTWEALENAHVAPNTLRGASVGVFIGSSNNDYAMLIAADPAEAHPYALTGTASSIIPNRISYAFDFRGPSVSVDTACSSSLVAVHQAVRSLRDGDADVAVAGGVNVLASPFVTTAFGELGVLSPTGHIHAFSDDADGFIRSDAAGVIVLKRVKDALADGDEILAVIKGSAVNSDGHSNGLTAPNPDAQIDVLSRAYDDAGIDPAEVDYIEAHGTGTILGDPIEATALGAVLGDGRDPKHPTLLGSVKSNIGHSESAAGAAGLIKVVQAMQHGVIPPSLHFAAPNRYIDFDAERLEVVEDPREWPEYSERKVAGVSGFGFGGTNAHVVVSSFDPADYEAEAAAPGEAQLTDPEHPNAVLLPVSGLLPSRRRQAAADVADFLEGRPDADLVPLARSLARRNHGRSRAVISAETVDEAVKRLRQVADGKVSVGITAADSPLTMGPVFVYSGFGSQHRKMAKELVACSPMFRARLAELDERVQFESGWSILEIVADDEQTYDTETAQVAITAIQIALTDLLAAFGAKPAAVMGMSMGEIAAAYAAGGLSADDAMQIACHRARLMGEGEKSLPEDQLGAMAVVELSTEQLTELNADEAFAEIEPAVYAAPGMTTVGGPRDQVTALVEKLEGEGKFARLLNVKGAGHTSAVEPLLGELGFETAGIVPQPLHTPLFSSVDRGVVHQPGETIHDTDYWLRMTRQSVYFQDATEAAFANAHTMLVEIAPNPVAIMGMMNTAFSVGKPDAQLLFALKRKVSEVEALRDLLAKLYAAGAPVDLSLIYGPGELLHAPHITWKHQRYWTNARPSSHRPAQLPGQRVTLPGGIVAFSTDANQVPSALALLERAAEAVQPGAQLVAAEEYAMLPVAGEITTVVNRGVGGVTITVHGVTENGATTLLAEGFATALRLGSPTAIPGVQALQEGGADNAVATADTDDELDIEEFRWDPASGETVEARLRAIVSESMGYDVDDLPGELPLIDLGLDSLMGMRIKNRVENDFQIPPLQVQALRDASVSDVVRIVEDAVAAKQNSGTPLLEPVVSIADVKEAEQDVREDPEPGEGVGVAPRDAAERMVFGTWATLTGKAPAGVTTVLPEVDADVAKQIAERLSERAGLEITAEQVTEVDTLEPLANIVRDALETEVEGNIRVLRARAEGSTKPSVFMFHPAGGSSVVYQPLTRRLPEDIPVYGVERLEGSLEERAAAYIDEIREYSGGHPVVLGGWSFGGALAYEVAHQLRATDVEVAYIALLDTAQPSEPIPDTMEETKARWERYSDFASKTYGLEFPVPFELLETAGEEAMLAMLEQFLATTDASEHGLAAGVLEHQRASFVDNRILDKLDFARWAEVDVPVLLFRSERMHDGAIELEPRYAHIDPDGGWSAIVDELDIVQLKGDHLAVPDEPAIGVVGAHMARRIEDLDD